MQSPRFLKMALGVQRFVSQMRKLRLGETRDSSELHRVYGQAEPRSPITTSPVAHHMTKSMTVTLPFFCSFLNCLCTKNNFKPSKSGTWL